MPNYSLVLNAKFKPFSYQEMLAPVMAATQAHQALEEEYGSLSSKASVWDELANEQTDPYAYKMYKTYSNDLAEKADQLMRYGLNPASRRSMLDMRSRYSKEIVPIETAYKRREELAAEQRKAIAANPTLRYQRMASQMSLDDFIKNPSIDYGKSYSGALLAQQVSQAAANYAKVLTEEGGLEKLGLPYQYKSRIRYGASPEEILAVINNAALEGHQGAVNFLRGIRDQVIQSSGVADWADPLTLKEFTSYANLGLYNALGQSKVNDYTDNYSMQTALIAKKAAAAKKNKDEQENPRLPYRIGDSLNTSGAEGTSIAKSDLEFLRKINKQPSLVRQSQVTKAASSSSMVMGRHLPGDEISSISYPNYNRLKQIEEKYGIKVAGTTRVGDQFTLGRNQLDKLMAAVEKRSNIGAVVDHLWIGNSTDNSWVVDGINENIRSYKAQHGKADVYKFEDGKRGDRLSSKDYDNLTSTNGSYYTFIDSNNEVRFVMTYKDKDNKDQTVEVGLNAVGGRDLQERADAVTEALNSGDTNRATLEMDNIYRIIDGNANTRAMTQAKSSSKINLEAPVDYNYLDVIFE